MPAVDTGYSRQTDGAFLDMRGRRHSPKTNVLVRCVQALMCLLIVISGCPGLCATQVDQSQSPPCDSSSDYSLPAVEITGLAQLQPKLSIGLMPSRYLDLMQVAHGYALSCTPLVAFDGHNFLPAGYSDDLGIYYVVPWVSRTFHMRLERSIALVLLSTMLLGLAVGCWGFFYALQSRAGKAISVIALLVLTAIAYHVGDVYVFEYAICLAVLPWALYFIRSKPSTSTAFLCFIVVAGIVTGTGSLIRFSSAPPTLVVIALLLVFYVHANIRKKIVLVAILAVSFFLPRLYFHHLISQRDGFLMTKIVGYQAGEGRHSLGHFAYAGLGFLSNPYVPGGVKDEVAKNKVQAVAPGAPYLSLEYDRVLRHEVMSIAIRHPNLFFFTICAKLGVVAGVILVFANFGLLAALWYPKPWQLDFAFWIALAISAAPVVLFAPVPLYLLGVISLAVVYGVVSLDQAFTSRKGAFCPTIQAERSAGLRAPASLRSEGDPL